MTTSEDPLNADRLSTTTAQTHACKARGAAVAPAPERTQPHIERLSHGGIEWIHIEEPSALERAWLAEHFDFHALDLEDVMSRNQRPKIDEYPDYLFIILHFPIFDKQVGRLNAGELDLFVGPDFIITLPNQPLKPVEYLFERCRTNEEVREQLFSKGTGYLLYQIVDQAVDYCFPMLRKIGNKLEQLEEEIFIGRGEEIVRDISNVKQEIINFRKIDPAPAPRAARPRAHEAALHARGAGGLLRRHRRRLGADLGHARELQGGRGGARRDERVGDLAPRQRDPACADRDQRHRAAADVHREPVGMNVGVPGEGDLTAFWIITGVMVAMLVGMVPSSAAAAGCRCRRSKRQAVIDAPIDEVWSLVGDRRHPSGSPGGRGERQRFERASSTPRSRKQAAARSRRTS